MIRLLLLAFPRAWRRRYGPELAQLIDDAGLTLPAAIDVVRSGIGERVRALAATPEGGSTMSVGPAWRHPRAFAFIALLVLMPTLLFVIGSLLTYQVGLDPLAGPMNAITGWLGRFQPLSLLLAAAPAVALLIAVTPLVRIDMKSNGDQMAVVGLRVRAGNLCVAALALTVGLVLVWYLLAESVVGR